MEEAGRFQKDGMMRCPKCGWIDDNEHFFAVISCISKAEIDFADSDLMEFLIDLKCEEARDKLRHEFGLDDGTFNLSKELNKK